MATISDHFCVKIILGAFYKYRKAWATFEAVERIFIWKTCNESRAENFNGFILYLQERKLSVFVSCKVF